jgi:DNA-binding FadR family transcriptional regulator
MFYFHEALADLAKNPILQLPISSSRGSLRENIRILIEHHSSAADEAMTYHRRIAQAVTQRRPQEARQAMQEHLEAVGRGLRELQAQDLISLEEEVSTTQ